MSDTLLEEDFTKICRTCVKIQEDMLGINDNDILIMFTTCTSVKVSLHNVLKITFRIYGVPLAQIITRAQDC